MINTINNSVKTRNIQDKNNKNNTSFKGPGTAVLTGLRALNNSPAIGACAVDLCSMVIPRTAIEAKNRGAQAGIEAAFREGASCLIHACVGLIGLGAGALVSKQFNKNNGIKAQNIFASGNTINNLSELWESSEHNQKQFFQSFIQNIKGLNGTNWTTISCSAKDDIVDGLVSLAEKTEELSKASGVDKSKLAKEIKNLKSVISAKVIQDTGAQASFKLSAGTASKEVSSSLSELIDNAVSLSNTFKNKTEDALPNFVKALSKNKVATTILGMGICAALCMSVQPINRYLTKKRTGQDGFVGVENGKGGDTSKGFKAAKTAAGIAFPIFAMKTIGKFPDLLSNIQFNSKVPTINQFKFLYGLTIGSRFLSSRDGNELRESVIKDTLGFTNWLILGGMVSKITARLLGGKELINNPIKQEGKKGIGYALKWIANSSVKSFDEVLLPNAKEAIKDGKVLSFKSLYKSADKVTKSKIHKIAGSQIAGYLYSGIVLGVGIAKLNIFITKKIQENKKKKETGISTTQTNKQVPTTSTKTVTKPIINNPKYENLKQEKSAVFKEFN